MAWTAPKYWIAGDMVTAALLNLHIKENLLALSMHAHGGAAGAGNDEMTGLDTIALDNIGAAAVAGLLRRNGNALTWGAGGYVITNVDDVAGVACLRTLGAGAQQASAGNHGH